MLKKSYNKSLYPLIFSIILVLGLYLGKILSSDGADNNSALKNKYYKLNSVLKYIESEYVDTIYSNDLIEKVLPHLLEELDPHSVYIPAKELLSVNEALDGNFDGIGVQFNIQNDTIVVVHVISGGPSEKEGLLAGDRIVTIDDTIAAGVKITNNDVLKKLKGPKETIVKVGVKRKNVKELLFFNIIRDKIPLYSIDVSYMVEKNIGYIKISNFSSTTYQEFRRAVNKLKKEGLEKVILDLRGNGGGYLDAATKIADEFLSEKQLIVYTEGKSRPKTAIFSTSRGTLEQNDVCIIIDEWSASASEILAGAIQDNDRGTIIGRRSFGKGLVQEQTMLPDGSAIRLTIARYHTPTGRCIQKEYKEGYDSYLSEISERFEHGEFVEKDSIKLLDSLKYTTPKGKIVYGGGGIMPDIFIPADTSGVTNYYSQVINKGIVYQFAFKYVDENRDFLKRFKNVNELSDFLDKAHLVNQFILFAEDKGVKKKYNEIKISEDLLHTQIKAFIARNIFDNDGFYPIIKSIDEPLTKAIEILN